MPADNISYTFEFCRPIEMVLGQPVLTFISAFLSVFKNEFRVAQRIFYFNSDFKNDFSSEWIVHFSDFMSVFKMNFGRPNVLSFFFF
jgi:hypothetical protein